MIMATCDYPPCGVTFEPKRPHQHYHHERCRLAHHKERKEQKDEELEALRKRNKQLEAIVKRNKYHARKIEIDGIRFDSQKEADRYCDLRLLQRAGEIISIEPHPVYPIKIEGKPICKVILDFAYCDKYGALHVEDVKGKDTPVSRLKRKMVEAVYGFRVDII